MLLLTLHKFALRLQPLRIPSAIVTGLGWAVLAWALIAGDEAYSLLLRATLTITLWSLVLFAFINLFQTLPPPLLPALKWHERLVSRIRLGLFYTMTFAFLALVFSVAGISLKLMMLG